VNGIQEAPGVGWAAEEIGGFLERLVVLEESITTD